MLVELKEYLELLRGDLEELKRRPPSSYLGPDASRDAAEDLAHRKAFDYRAPSRGEPQGQAILQAVGAARRGDPSAFASLTSDRKWAEAVDSAGGFLVDIEALPGYLPARRAASPLRERCSNYSVRSHEVLLAVEGASVTVSHLAEGATKPDSSGTVGQLTTGIYKVAGTSHVSDELLADSSGNVSDIVARQFAQAIGVAIDTAVISGTGVGSPTGIRNATGVNATATDGQDGQALFDSILKAEGRLREDFFEADTVAVHPRELAKFRLARASGTGEYLFPQGIEGALGAGKVVVDANIPTTLGAGLNESIIIVGDFRNGALFLSRQALEIDSSRDAGWVTDETVFRAVERYGFAVTRPAAFEIITGITP
jgi:HK97 family phage major capsid protein